MCADTFGESELEHGVAGELSKSGLVGEESIGSLWREDGEFCFEGEGGIEGSEGEVECGGSWAGHDG
jgi:hypothetical protein